MADSEDGRVTAKVEDDGADDESGWNPMMQLFHM